MSVQRPNPRRADERGRAYKGSQRQIQRYVNECPVRLNRAILACVPSLATPAPQVTWVSPLDEKRCAEYSDREFLERLGLADLWPALRKFWPSSGGCSSPGRCAVGRSEKLPGRVPQCVSRRPPVPRDHSKRHPPDSARVLRVVQSGLASRVLPAGQSAGPSAFSPSTGDPCVAGLAPVDR